MNSLFIACIPARMNIRFTQAGVLQGRSKVALMAKAWTLQGWHRPLARPAGLPARLRGAGRTVGNGLRRQTERLTRSVRRVAGRYGPVARATRVCNRAIMPDFRAPLGGQPVIRNRFDTAQA